MNQFFFFSFFDLRVHLNELYVILFQTYSRENLKSSTCLQILIKHDVSFYVFIETKIYLSPKIKR